MNQKCVYNYTFGFVDFPDNYSMTLFFSGCNLRCSFCYNNYVVEEPPNFTFESCLKKLKENEQILSNTKIPVVLSGGEPIFNKYINKYMSFLIERGNKLCLQSNGIMLPKTNPFEAVILSLKPIQEINIPKDVYINKLKKAFDFYKGSKYKELRVVDIPNYKSQYEDLLNSLYTDIYNSGFNVKYVKFLSF